MAWRPGSREKGSGATPAWTGEAATLGSWLPPLPAGRAAAVHHALAARRRRLIATWSSDPAALARAVWALEPRSGGGFGHGLMVIGRVP